MKFDIVDESVAYQGFFRVKKFSIKHELFQGGTSETYTRELFERGHAASVLMFDPKLRIIVLIEQFRVGAIQSSNPWTVELVAGVVEHGEVADEVARREAEEEAGVVLGELEFICSYYNSVGGSSETTSLYFAEVDSTEISGIHGLKSENEDIRIVKFHESEFFRYLASSEVLTGSLVTAGYWLKHRLKA